MNRYRMYNEVDGLGEDYQKWMQTRQYKKSRNEHYKRKVKHQNVSALPPKRCR